jgi:hypothetical protein
MMPDPGKLLVAQLQLAHAGELAAGYAYRGHWRSARDPEVAGHPLLRLFPLWPAAPPRERIRQRFEGEEPTVDRMPVPEAVRG